MSSDFIDYIATTAHAQGEADPLATHNNNLEGIERSLRKLSDRVSFAWHGIAQQAMGPDVMFGRVGGVEKDLEARAAEFYFQQDRRKQPTGAHLFYSRFKHPKYACWREYNVDKVPTVPHPVGTFWDGEYATHSILGSWTLVGESKNPYVEFTNVGWKWSSYFNFMFEVPARIRFPGYIDYDTWYAVCFQLDSGALYLQTYPDDQPLPGPDRAATDYWPPKNAIGTVIVTMDPVTLLPAFEIHELWDESLDPHLVGRSFGRLIAPEDPVPGSPVFAYDEEQGSTRDDADQILSYPEASGWSFEQTIRLEDFDRYLNTLEGAALNMGFGTDLTAREMLATSVSVGTGADLVTIPETSKDTGSYSISGTYNTDSVVEFESIAPFAEYDLPLQTDFTPLPPIIDPIGGDGGTDGSGGGGGGGGLPTDGGSGGGPVPDPTTGTADYFLSGGTWFQGYWRFLDPNGSVTTGTQFKTERMSWYGSLLGGAVFPQQDDLYQGGIVWTPRNLALAGDAFLYGTSNPNYAHIKYGGARGDYSVSYQQSTTQYEHGPGKDRTFFVANDGTNLVWGLQKGKYILKASPNDMSGSFTTAINVAGALQSNALATAIGPNGATFLQYNGSLWVAWGKNANGMAQCATSPDLVTWTLQPTEYRAEFANPPDVLSFAKFNGAWFRFVSNGSLPTRLKVYRSVDLIEWLEVFSSTNDGSYKGFYGRVYPLKTKIQYEGWGWVAQSLDGITWTEHNRIYLDLYRGMMGFITTWNLSTADSPEFLAVVTPTSVLEGQKIVRFDDLLDTSPEVLLCPNPTYGTYIGPLGHESTVNPTQYPEQANAVNLNVKDDGSILVKGRMHHSNISLHVSGKKYFEIKVPGPAGAFYADDPHVIVGVVSAQHANVGEHAARFGDGGWYYGTEITPMGSHDFGIGDVVGVAADLDNRECHFYVNGVLKKSLQLPQCRVAPDNLNPYMIYLKTYFDDGVQYEVELNTGQKSFAHSVAGYSAWSRL